MNDRRGIVSLTGLWLFCVAWNVMAVILALRTVAASGPGDGKASAPELRLWKSLNSGWVFKRQAAPGPAVEPEFVGAEKPEYDDSSWTPVHLPHTWDATPDNPFATTDHFHGLGWYRRRLEIPAEWRGGRGFLLFSGGFPIADARLNGRPIRSEEDTAELPSPPQIVFRLLLLKKKKTKNKVVSVVTRCTE